MLYPFMEPPYRMTMGLVALDPADWILIDETFDHDMAEKGRLLAERHADVFATVPGAETGSRVVLDALIDHLPRRFPDLYARQGDGLRRQSDGSLFHPQSTALHPLDLAGRLVQEDLCLMQRQGDNWILGAASLCSPTRWRLAEKIGRPLAPIHAPVPGFAGKFGTAVERFFDRLAPGRGVWRANWGLIDDPTLFQPGGHFRGGVDAQITAGNAGDKLWLRVERQTLRRLGDAAEILFTIRILQEPLASTAAVPLRARRLAENIRTMPPDLKAYKSIAPFEDALLGYLDRAAAL